jgi:hypothetical protein
VSSHNPHRVICLDPNLRAARQGLVWAVYQAAVLEFDFVTLAVLFVVFNGKDGQFRAFGISPDIVLVNVDSSFHRIFLCEFYKAFSQRLHRVYAGLLC